MTQHILALDRGTKRIGLAWCNTDVATSLPLGYLENNTLVYAHLASLVAQYHIDIVVVGYPRGSGLLPKLDKFILSLKFSLDPRIEIVTVDEHYSSVEASDRTGDFDRKHISQDTVSAMIILERYMSTDH